MIAAHVSPKQIARDLGISENTVRGYLAEAIDILGASDLRDAARIYLASMQSTPQNFGGRDERVAVSHKLAAKVVEEEAVVPEHAAPKLTAGGHFHFLRGERQRNDLTIPQRLLWIIIGSVTALVLFATSAFALGALAKLAAALKG